MDQLNAEKPYGISFESADVYADSLGIQIKDYEMIPIIMNVAITGDIVVAKPQPNAVGKIMVIWVKENPNNYSYHALLIYELLNQAEKKELDYVCSIKIFGVNNLESSPQYVERSHWMNVLTATGLRRKPESKTKSTPPPILTLPSREGQNG